MNFSDGLCGHGHEANIRSVSTGRLIRDSRITRWSTFLIVRRARRDPTKRTASTACKGFFTVNRLLLLSLLEVLVGVGPVASIGCRRNSLCVYQDGCLFPSQGMNDMLNIHNSVCVQPPIAKAAALITCKNWKYMSTACNNIMLRKTM